MGLAQYEIIAKNMEDLNIYFENVNVNAECFTKKDLRFIRKFQTSWFYKRLGICKSAYDQMDGKSVSNERAAEWKDSLLNITMKEEIPMRLFDDQQLFEDLKKFVFESMESKK